jgi:hypothetical protein
MKVALTLSSRKKAKPLPTNTLRYLPCPKTCPFTILDTGTDISILGQGWSVVKRYNHLHTVDGEALRLVDVVAHVANPLEPKPSLGRIRVCRALHKQNAQESLIPPAQLSWNGLNVCTKPLLNGGQQAIYSAKRSIALFFRR